MSWQEGIDDQGRAFTIDDPLAARTAAALQGADTAEEKVAALLALDSVFPPELANDPELARLLAAWLHRLDTEGARATLGRL